MPRHLLNIASIVCLVAWVALMGMWVRSYFPRGVRTTGFSRINSTDGRLTFCGSPFTDAGIIVLTSGGYRSVFYTHQDSQQSWTRGTLDSRYGFGFARSSAGLSILMLPYWFLVLVSGSLAMAFQLRWPPRFTIRSLFVATTFFAVVLGMIAWLDRAWIGK
jgi:hypothetical protein